jgi:large subunit GTPase 1
MDEEVYLDWRRELSELEEKYRFVQVTPYEKNIEIWRQLWMAIEKSDILVQVGRG